MAYFPELMLQLGCESGYFQALNLRRGHATQGKSTDEIISSLREAKVRLGQRETVGKNCGGFGIYARLQSAGVVHVIRW